MRRFLLLIVLIAAAGAAYWFFFRPKGENKKADKMKAITVKKHSENFNAGVDNMMSAYFNMKNAFVEDDTAAVRANARVFIAAVDSLSLIELKNDTAGIFETASSNATDIKSNAESLITQTDITEMRHDFSMVTEMMYPSFLKAINYEGNSLYVQHCPMAFGEEQSANWISNSTEIMNPYLGRKHPKYKAGMLHCGELKDSITAK